MYDNSAELARATPHVRLSRPTPPDNTEWYSFDEQRTIEPAKACLCFDCQKPIEPGKGLQVRRHLGAQGTPCEGIVHPACNEIRTMEFNVGHFVCGQDVLPKD